ncbi:MAG: GNAT family N-acetyltransferase [Ktedonobacteraceae bacterium]|nr:GNAT family N-acetyltransferase [Ktedonobacteraceae bacterium]
MTEVRVDHASIEDAAVVIDLVERLLRELGGFAFDKEGATRLCEQLLATGRYTALLARDAEGSALGVLTLHESSALYVVGKLGWIQEFYVVPEARSLGVGHLLAEEATRCARERGWSRLEVNTPNAQEWPRTVAFYRREGFEGGSYHLRKFFA